MKIKNIMAVVLAVLFLFVGCAERAENYGNNVSSGDKETEAKATGVLSSPDGATSAPLPNDTPAGFESVILREFSIGSEEEIDLNGDGQLESVLVEEMSTSVVTIIVTDGAQERVWSSEQEELYEFYADRAFFVDMDPGDLYIEILLMCSGPVGGTDSTELFRYDGSESLLYASAPGKFVRLGEAAVVVEDWTWFIGTLGYEVPFTLTDSFILARSEWEEGVLRAITWQDIPDWIVVHADINVIFKEGDQYVPGTLESGSHIKFTATDFVKIVCFVTQDGREGQFEYEYRVLSEEEKDALWDMGVMHDGNGLYNIDGKPEYEVFDGIEYAG